MFCQSKSKASKSVYHSPVLCPRRLRPRESKPEDGSQSLEQKPHQFLITCEEPGVSPSTALWFVPKPWSLRRLESECLIIPWSNNEIILGYISLLNVEKAGTRARPICEITRASCALMWSNTCATFNVTTCRAFGGRDGRGKLVWKRQSSVITDARTEMQRVRSSDAKTSFFLVGEGERDFPRVL
jgi:hypothetical protein